MRGGSLRSVLLTAASAALVACAAGAGKELVGWEPPFGLCWAAPLYPAVEPAARDASCHSSLIGFGAVDSRQPTLRWTAFPGPMDQEGLGLAALKRITAVRYDLRIWRVSSCAPQELVYQRDGLREREHRLEARLAPATRYFWTFRARYVLDGEEKVLPWASFAPPGASCPLGDIPGDQYYRFATPGG